MQQLQLPQMILDEDLTKKLIAKQKQYNAAHQSDPLDIQETAKMMLEYAIKYLDVTAIE